MEKSSNRRILAVRLLAFGLVLTQLSSAPASMAGASVVASTEAPSGALADATSVGLDALFTDPLVRPTKAQSEIPSDLAPYFFALAPGDDMQEVSNFPAEEEGSREPASTQLRSKSAKNLKNAGSAKSASAATSRRYPTALASQANKKKGRWPSSVSDGIEVRVRYGQQVSTIWVVKRSDRHDLLFSNNAGSRASVGLSSDNFQYLLETAKDLKSSNANIEKCKNASMQVHLVSQGGPERVLSACLNAKDKPAESLKQFGSMLSSYVR